MKFPRWTQHPRWLAALALVFALVPAWLAVVTWRDAREKDERLFQTSAQVLQEQLEASFGRNAYFLGVLRTQARERDPAALAREQIVPAADWKEKLPYLIAYGYAEQVDGRAILRWKSDERAPVPGIGDDLADNPAVAAALAASPPPKVAAPTKAPAPDPVPHSANAPPAGAGAVEAMKVMVAQMLFPLQSVAEDGHRLVVLLPVVRPREREPRGYIAGWVNTAALCRNDTLPLLRDAVLSATPLVAGAPLPDGALRATMRESGTEWTASIQRGPHFSREYGAPAPWLAFLAAGLSAVPLLVLAALAGRAAKLRTALAAEQEVLRQQRYFTQSVSHEFRTPLGIILSGTDLLDQYAAHLTPERRAEVLREMRDNTRHLNDMVERILLLGRMESGKHACAPAPVNVKALCEDIAHKAMTAAPGSSINVTAPDQDATLDAALLVSILDNLLSNAVKYSAPGQPVTLTAAVEEQRVLFTVRDEGIGIPPEDLPHVCDPFHRCANVGDAPGTGLGLAIAQRCASLHGGTFKIESTPGRGTTATASIPLS